MGELLKGVSPSPEWCGLGNFYLWFRDSKAGNGNILIRKTSQTIKATYSEASEVHIEESLFPPILIFLSEILDLMKQYSDSF